MLCRPRSEIMNQLIFQISIFILLKGKFPIFFHFIILLFKLSVQAGQGIRGREESNVEKYCKWTSKYGREHTSE